MNRWSRGLDTPLGQDGDPPPGTTGPAFKGIDMVRDRDKLAPGMVARAENKRMRTGSCLKRPGNVQPSDFNPAMSNPIIGSGLFNNPNGYELMLVACLNDSFVWVLQDGKDPFKVNLVAGQNLVGLGWARFCQAFNNVLLFRPTKPPLVWDGDPAHQFVTFPAPSPGGGGTPIPNAHAGETFQNRVLYYYPAHPSMPYRDQMIMSDPGDYTQYDNVFADFRINSGQSDSIMRVWQYYRGAAVVFKRKMLHMLENFTGRVVDISGTIDYSGSSQRMVTRRFGLVAWTAVVEDGGDLLFVSEPGGIYRLSEVIQEQIVAPPTPVSEPIQPVIDRINWPAAFGGLYSGIGACAETLGDYAYFAIPLYAGAPAGNDAVIVYNLISKQWESAPDWWEDPTFRINAMHVTQYAGVRTLFGLDYVGRRIYALYQSVPDQVNDALWHIHDRVATRGYNLGDSTSFKRFQRTALALSTVDPQITVTAVSDGVNEEKVLTPEPITKDRLSFYPHAHPPYVPHVTDPDEPMREDYSTAELNTAGQDFETLPVGPITTLPATAGELLDAPAQESLERLQIRTNARWCSLEIENESGRCDLLAVGVEAIPANMETRTAA